jgi:hypothetical protein
LKTYGTPANPFPELPPAASFYSVAWSGVKGVKWMDSAYITALRETLTISNSPKGTLSAWFKFPATDRYTIFEGVNNDFRLDITPGGYLDSFPTSGAVTVSTRFLFGAAANGGGFEEPYNQLVVFEDNANIADTGKWYHVYAEWDTAASSFLMKVNNVTVSGHIFPGDDYISDSYTGPPFDVPWKTDPLGEPDTFIDFFWFRYSVPLNVATYSVAEFWLATGVTRVGVDKFLTSSTNPDTGVTTYRPKSLGANGEKPMTPVPTEVDPDRAPVKPDFYFSRRGEPDTFLINRGTAGDFTLVGDKPIDETTSPKFTIPTTGTP